MRPICCKAENYSSFVIETAEVGSDLYNDGPIIMALVHSGAAKLSVPRQGLERLVVQCHCCAATVLDFLQQRFSVRAKLLNKISPGRDFSLPKF